MRLGTVLGALLGCPPVLLLDRWQRAEVCALAHPTMAALSIPPLQLHSLAQVWASVSTQWAPVGLELPLLDKELHFCS